MSKIDAQRAMREARYERQRAGIRPGTPARRPPVAPEPVAPPRDVPRRAARPAPAAEPAVTPTAGSPEPCGHRNMSGRTCTREQGHAAKSHRYG